MSDMQKNIQERIVFNMAACFFCICVPFVIYRAYTGETLHVWILSFLILACSSVLLCIKYGYFERGRYLFLATIYPVLIFLNFYFGTEKILWQSTGIVALTFALRSIREVVLVCTSLVLICTYTLSLNSDFELIVTYVASQGSLVILCTIVSHLLSTQILLAQSDALLDGLTGLLNRKALDAALFSHCKDEESPENCVLALIDIDHFKQLNDEYGHAFGDEVLRSISNTITGVIRKSDSAYRYGGEEFAVLLPDTDFETATTIAERIRGAIESGEHCPPNSSKCVMCTASIGLSKNAKYTSSEWLENCDLKLYEAKNSGRNCVKVDDGEIIL